MSGSIYDPLSLPQILGYIATIFGIIGFQQKDDTKLKIFVLMMSGFVVSHFILMGSYTAAASAALAASRWGLSIFVAVRKRAYIFVPLFISLFIICAVLTFRQWYDIFPPMASICVTLGLFYFSRIRLRLILLTGNFLWIAHNFFALSYGPLIMESFLLISNIIMIIRFVVDNKKLPRDPKGSFLSRFG